MSERNLELQRAIDATEPFVDHAALPWRTLWEAAKALSEAPTIQWCLEHSASWIKDLDGCGFESAPGWNCHPIERALVGLAGPGECKERKND